MRYIETRYFIIIYKIIHFPEKINHLYNRWWLTDPHQQCIDYSITRGVYCQVHIHTTWPSRAEDHHQRHWYTKQSLHSQCSTTYHLLRWGVWWNPPSVDSTDHGAWPWVTVERWWWASSSITLGIRVYSRERKKIRSFGSQGSSTGQFQFPHGIAITPDNHILSTYCRR